MEALGHICYTNSKSDMKKYWTETEDTTLKTAVEKYGSKSWKLVSAEVLGRSPVQCLHRWSKIL